MSDPTAPHKFQKGDDPRRGRFPPGKSGNPSGRSSEHQKAQGLMRSFMALETTFEAWKAAYLELLAEKNPVIVKDYADRIDGKPVERVAHQNADGSNLFQPLDLTGLPDETVMVIRGQLRKLEADNADE